MLSQAESVLAQHKELHEVLDKIAAAIAARPPVADSGPWMAELSSHLETLRPQLEAHFAHEEQGGLFEEIEEEMPESGSLCARLSGEHGALVAKVESLCAESGQALPDDEALEALVGRCGLLLKELANHEALEDDLLFRALEGGIGAQD
jgi:iron-sulfur cluster repair protein YtfE (RIC family)